MARSLGTHCEPYGSPAGTETEGTKGVQRSLFCGSIPLCVIFLLCQAAKALLRMWWDQGWWFLLHLATEIPSEPGTLLAT